MSPTEWNDDEQEPPAPLPAHERVWRHPSEVGEQTWRMTEPPLVIGRGLSAATGVVGTLLGGMLLWAMISTEAGRGAVATARSTIVTLTDANFGAGSTSPVTSPATSAPEFEAMQAVETLTHVTLPIWLVHPAATTSTDATPLVQVIPVDNGALAITTAAAVEGVLVVQLELPGGARAAARVLFVDDRTGLAVLAPDTVRPGQAFTVAAEISPGDTLTFLGERRMSATVGADGTVDGEWADDAAMAEGAPVVNQRGELVALCSHQHGVARLVTLESLDDIEQAMSAFDGKAPVWLGVVINDDPSGELSVGAVDPAGPAHDAGLAAGDVILALDDEAIMDGRALVAHLGLHRPGDTVRVLVEHADGTREEIEVILDSPKTSL